MMRFPVRDHDLTTWRKSFDGTSDITERLLTEFSLINRGAIYPMFPSEYDITSTGSG
jgi:hypothetical protein